MKRLFFALGFGLTGAFSVTYAQENVAATNAAPIIALPASASGTNAAPVMVAPAEASLTNAAPIVALPASASGTNAAPVMVAPAEASLTNAAPIIALPASASATNAAPVMVAPAEASLTNAASTNAPPVVAPPASTPQTNAVSTNSPPVAAPPASLPQTNAATTNAAGINPPPAIEPQTNAASTNAPPVNPPPAVAPQPDFVQTFEGNGSTTTPLFQVPDRWEIRWSCLRVVSVAVFSSDGSMVAGAAGVLRGSLYVPKGGSYYLQIGAETRPGNEAGSTNSGASGTNSTSNEPAPHSVPGATNPSGWHVIVVEIGSPATPSQLTVFAPNFIPPPGSAQTSPPPAPAPPPPPVPAAAFTDDQARALVLISGDHSTGTGFLAMTPDGPVVVTNLHVIANNPNLKITTNTGAQITMLSARIAADRDVALLAIQDEHYSYLAMSTNISQSVQPGDVVLTPGAGNGSDVPPALTGKVREIDANFIACDASTAQATSGGPVIHTKSGNVLGVASEATHIPTANDLQNASFASRTGAASRSRRYVALRLDTVSSWVTVDWTRFQTESLFLAQFHEKSRALDAYLNPSQRRSWGDGDPHDPSQLYRNDATIMKANNLFLQLIAGGGDSDQRQDAFKGLLFDLGNIANTNMDQINNLTNFYSFDQARARNEVTYRNSLKAELESIANDPARLRALPKSSN